MPLPRDVGVVVVAAGQGRRAGAGTPKQFREIAGVPMVLRAVRPFAAHPDVAEVAVVLPPDVVAAPPAWLRVLDGEGVRLVPGGAERGDSVAAGLAALAPACQVVLVHDGARPFPSRSTIDAVIAEARAGRAALAAIPVSDTLKEAAGAERLVARTVPRDRLWRAQTPQGFPRALLERAYRGRAPGATDDAALVEAMGEPVVLVPDDAGNLKVTTEADFVLAEALARR